MVRCLVPPPLNAFFYIIDNYGENDMTLKALGLAHVAGVVAVYMFALVWGDYGAMISALASALLLLLLLRVLRLVPGHLASPYATNVFISSCASLVMFDLLLKSWWMERYNAFYPTTARDLGEGVPFVNTMGVVYTCIALTISLMSMYATPSGGGLRGVIVLLCTLCLVIQCTTMRDPQRLSTMIRVTCVTICAIAMLACAPSFVFVPKSNSDSPFTLPYAILIFCIFTIVLFERSGKLLRRSQIIIIIVMCIMNIAFMSKQTDFLDHTIKRELSYNEKATAFHARRYHVVG